MKNVLLYVWQLPQHLVALFLLCIHKHETIFLDGIRVYKIPAWDSWGAGVSLGQYILLAPKHCHVVTAHHESGHSVQSMWLGPLYLLTVGIVSASRNMWDRLFHKKWSVNKSIKWYYSAWPENQADKLGGVTRNYSS